MDANTDSGVILGRDVVFDHWKGEQLMIDKILDVVFWVAKAAISLLPTYTPPGIDSIQWLVNQLAAIDNFFPIVTLAECIAAYYTFVFLLMLARPILKWVRLA